MLDRALAKKLQKEEEKQHRQGLELEEKEISHIQQQQEKEDKQREKERHITMEFERMQSQLSTELRQQVELNYQRKFQEVQQHTPSSQAKEIPKTIKIQVENTRKDSYEASAPPELLICWRCGKIGHKKKDCTAILFCTNCGRNNHITRRCRQPLRENCTYCKRGDNTEEYFPVRRLDNCKQNQ